MRIAAVTMAFNEPDFVPIWRRHYGAMVGSDNLFLIDHGTDDGSTTGLGRTSVVALPRSPMDDRKRTAFLADFCSALLQFYDWVVCTDIDEFLVVDPGRFDSLAALCAAAPAPVMTAVGLNVHHLPRSEPDIDLSRRIARPRTWVRVVNAMCKPVLISRRVTWVPGLHACDAPAVFAPMFLMHLRHYDAKWGVKRLAKTREMPWADLAAGPHQRITDREFVRALIYIEDNYPRRTDVTLDLGEQPLRGLLEGIAAAGPGLDLEGAQDELWRLPKRIEKSF